MWSKRGNASVSAVLSHALRPLPVAEVAASSLPQNHAVEETWQHGHRLLAQSATVGIYLFCKNKLRSSHRKNVLLLPATTLSAQENLVWVVSQNSNVRIFLFIFNFYLNTENCLQFAPSFFVPECRHRPPPTPPHPAPSPNPCFLHKILFSVRAWVSGDH